MVKKLCTGKIKLKTNKNKTRIEKKMKKKMVELPILPIKRIVKNNGTERISADATKELAAIIEEYGSKIAKEAVELAKHAKRKTVMAKDIKLAARI